MRASCTALSGEMASETQPISASEVTEPLQAEVLESVSVYVAPFLHTLNAKCMFTRMRLLQPKTLPKGISEKISSTAQEPCLLTLSKVWVARAAKSGRWAPGAR